MNPGIARATLNVIRKERKRRLASLPDDAPVADGQWLSVDEPFVNELCLMFLVAIRHQVERELLILAARATDDGKTLDYGQYQERLNDERVSLKGRDGWKKLAARLRLDSVPKWNSSMEILRLLANCYKHAPSQGPEKSLLLKLGLNQARNYASLAESLAVRKGLARFLCLDEGSDYCDIADEFLRRADRFLSTVREGSTISAVKGGRGSSRPRSFLC
jgi:hypothetical protein